MQEHTDDLVGRKLSNYTLEKLIGRGGMGSVYLAQQERPRRRVAVKVLQSRMAGNGTVQAQDFLARFRREADVIARLEHTNIMPIYEYDEEDGLAFLVMPHVTGGSLRDLLTQQGSLSLDRVATYLDQAASALDYAHARGVIHRDLKPANFLIHADGRLILTDFGIARISEENTSGDTAGNLTKTGMFVGTPDFMAPEMASGETVDYRADIYELGIVLFTLLNGSIPFPDATPLSALMRRLQEPLPSLHQRHPEIPAAVDRILQKATALRREDRYTSLKAMSQEMHVAIKNKEHQQDGRARTNQDAIPTIIYTQPASSAPWRASQSASLPAPNQVTTPQVTTRPQYPYVPAHSMVPPTPLRYTASSSATEHRRWWPIIVLCILLLALGSVFAGIQIEKYLSGTSLAGKGTPTSSQTQTASTATLTTAIATTTPQTQTTGQPTQQPTTTNAPPTGNPLYETTTPGPNCDNGQGEWIDYNNAQITCNANATQISNTLPQKALNGIFLTTIAGKTYPSDYVVSAQVQATANSTGDFGLYFRNQPGQLQGTYTFLIRANNTWLVTVYDNETGAPTVLASGQIGDGKATTMLQLAVMAKGSQFSFYINNQQITNVIDSTYAQGTAGIALNKGASISISQFALYTDNERST